MGWQQYVADVAGEYSPITGLPAYQVIVVSVPRQSGKTTIELVVIVDRGTVWDMPQRMGYSAQTGQDARQKVINDFWPLISRSPIKVATRRLLRGAAETAIIFRNSSRLEVLASAEDAGHGRTLDVGFIDEAFADEDDRREQAMVPAMATRPWGQLYVFSTQGTGRSAYFNRKVAEGRAAAEAGLTSGIAYFEWSAPDDADPDDPATWQACMPALGRTISLEAVQLARQTMTDGEFRRAYLNQRSDHEARWIPPEAWAACRGDLTLPPDGTPIVAAFDGSYNNDATAIAGTTLDGHVFEIGLWERPLSAGPDWVVPRHEVDKRIHEMFGRWKVLALTCDRSRWYDQTEAWWERYGDAVKDAGATDRRRMVDACALFYGAVMQRKLSHDGSGNLTRHLANAVVRETSDGAYITKDGRNSPRKIDLAVAAVMAYQASLSATVPLAAPTPWVSFGGKHGRPD
jgi:phage terminase large subunit-like protein